MLIQSIKLTNVLSFGPDTQELELKSLNVLIGPNGSGKSNLIEVIGLLKAAPMDLLSPIRESGGAGNWIWRGELGSNLAEIEALIPYQNNRLLRYTLVLRKDDQRFQVNSEQLEPVRADDESIPYFSTDGEMAHLLYDRGLHEGRVVTTIKPVRISADRSIFAQVKGPMFPELTQTGEQFNRIGLFREWSFGRHNPPRLPQKADLPNNFLMEGGQNLGLVLNWLKREPKAADRLLSALRQLYASIVDFDVHIEGGTVQVFLREGDVTVPATRLSDGTLRYLCLLAILCHRTPPPLVCIEEPELGLHPDILPGLAELLREASTRCQLIVTTHSDVIVDALTDTPESVVICEKQKGQTTLKRLDKDGLAHWLERYRLGDLWTSGELGGNRW